MLTPECVKLCIAVDGIWCIVMDQKVVFYALRSFGPDTAAAATAAPAFDPSGAKTITRHEVALFFIRSDYTCGLIPEVPTNAGLVLKVKLLDFFGKLKELEIKCCADHQR